MIIYSDIVKIENLPFDDYLKLPGFSHSFFKRQKNGLLPVMNMTDNIRLGSIVDTIITEPDRANMMHPLYPAAKRIAGTLQKQFGPMITQFKKQISYTAVMTFSGMRVPVTGRLDFLLESFAVIDLKITLSKNVQSVIQFMGYENQLWHYSKLAGVKKGYIMIYSVPLDRTFVIQINVTEMSNAFWEDKILLFGQPTENTL